MYRRIDKPYMTATLDGKLVEIATGRKGILEIKTREIKNREDAENWQNGKIPDNYYIQCLHYLSVLNDHEFAILVAKLNFLQVENRIGFFILNILILQTFLMLQLLNVSIKRL